MKTTDHSTISIVQHIRAVTPKSTLNRRRTCIDLAEKERREEKLTWLLAISFALVSVVLIVITGSK